MNFKLVDFSIFLFNIHKKATTQQTKNAVENLKELPQEL